MTTPILPTRIILRETKLTPKDLIRDEQVEVILRDHYALLTGFFAAWRDGLEEYSYAAGSPATAGGLRTVLTEYGYWVAAAPSSSTIDFSWAAANPYL